MSACRMPGSRNWLTSTSSRCCWRTRKSRSAINNFLNAQERLVAAEEAVAASQRSVEIVELQYREGVADFNRVYNLQRLLVQDQDRLAANKGEVALSLIAAYKAIGGGWEIRNGYAAGAAALEPLPPGRTDARRSRNRPGAGRDHAVTRTGFGTRNQVVHRRQPGTGTGPNR